MNATRPVYVHCGGVGPPCRSLCSATPNATAIAIVSRHRNTTKSRWLRFPIVFPIQGQ
mgnify:FL=1